MQLLNFERKLFYATKLFLKRKWVYFALILMTYYSICTYLWLNDYIFPVFMTGFLFSFFMLGAMIHIVASLFYFFPFCHSFVKKYRYLEGILMLVLHFIAVFIAIDLHVAALLELIVPRGNYNPVPLVFFFVIAGWYVYKIIRDNFDSGLLK